MNMPSHTSTMWVYKSWSGAWESLISCSSSHELTSYVLFNLGYLTRQPLSFLPTPNIATVFDWKQNKTKYDYTQV